MSTIDHIAGIWSIGTAFSMLFYLYCNLSIAGFIVRRYKLETQLSDTVCFRDHATFIRYLPTFLAGGFYATHLMICLWGWRIYGHRKAFKDIKNPEEVTQHFTVKEIRRIKRLLISSLIAVFHAVAFVFFKILWPEQFA